MSEREWTHVQSWHRYPYKIEQEGGLYRLLWHHNVAGVSHTIKVSNFPSELMEYVENIHGPDNGWRTCVPSPPPPQDRR